MRVFVAGASGAIGQPLVAELLRTGHTVTAMSHSPAGAKRLEALGVSPLGVDAFDSGAIEQALRDSKAEAVIDELTSLPKNPADLSSALPNDRKLRLDGGGHLHRAAERCGVRRYIQQASGFFLKAPAGALADESAPLDVNASAGIVPSATMYTQLEQRVLGSSVQGIALRYGFFYGPNTWYHPQGASADTVRQQQFPIVGDGAGVWSFVHIEDAARATVAALTAAPGVYNIVDSDPSPMSVWLPAFAKAMGAPQPPRVTEEAARLAAGEDAVYYGMRLSGASNAKAKRELGFQPRRLEWLAAR